MTARSAGKKAIMGALRLYLDFINLFLFLLRLHGQSPLSGSQASTRARWRHRAFFFGPLLSRIGLENHVGCLHALQNLSVARNGSDMRGVKDNLQEAFSAGCGLPGCR